MPSIETRTVKARVETMRRKMVAPRVFLFNLKVSEWKRADDGISPVLHRVYIRDQRLFNSRTGASFIRSENDAALFDEEAKLADEIVDWPISINVVPNEEGESFDRIVWDMDTPSWLVSAGVRSGKSEHGAAFLSVRAFYRGGHKRKFWIVMNSVSNAHDMMEKFLRYIPSEFVVSHPENIQQRVQDIVLLDGSIIKLRHTMQSKQGNLFKGSDVWGVWWSEFGSGVNDKNYTAVRSRRMDHKANLYLEGTAELNPLVRERIYLPALEEKRKDARRSELLSRNNLNPEESAELSSLRGLVLGVRLFIYASKLNPFIDPNEIEREYQEALKTNPAEADRQYKGLFIGDRNLLFKTTFDRAENCFVVDDDRLHQICGVLGLDDITDKITPRFFGAPYKWVIGCDVNKQPHSLIFCKILGKFGKPETYRLYVHQEHRYWGKSTMQVAQELTTFEGGRYKGAAIAIDCAAFYKNQPIAHRAGTDKAPGQFFNEQGFCCRPVYRAFGRTDHPDIRESTAHVQTMFARRSIIINPRFAQHLIKAIEMCEDDGQNRPYKVSNTFTDREIVGMIDCLRYTVHALFVLTPNRPPVSDADMAKINALLAM